MKVIFKETWFTGNRRFRKSALPQEVPDEMRDLLPSGTRIVDDDYVERKAKELSIQELDEERAASDNYSEIMNRAFNPIEMVMPKAFELISKFNLNQDDIKGTGKEGRITLANVQEYIDNRS